MSTFDEQIKKHFVGAMKVEDYVEKMKIEMNKLGFKKENAIMCFSTCRDENTTPLANSLEKTWGDLFNLSGLAGMLFCGKTSFSAGIHHAPIENKIERYIFVGMAHIAINEKGEIGVCTRPNRPGNSTSCGALCGFRKELASIDTIEKTKDYKEKIKEKIDLNGLDVEMALLKKKMIKKIEEQYPDVVLSTLSLVQLTKLAREDIEEDFEKIIKVVVEDNKNLNYQYVYTTGTIIHAKGETWIHPNKFFGKLGRNVEKKEIEIKF